MSQTYTYTRRFGLESGAELTSITISYDTFGTLNNDRSNVIWICHALTANSDVSDWWSGIFGKGKALDPTKHFIVCANVIGSHYGSTGPLETNPETGQPWYGDFPLLSVRDLVKAHILLRKHLGIDRIYSLMGGSLGGQQALEWAVIEPDVVNRLLVIATNAKHSPWGIAFNETQRMAIQADPTFGEPRASAGQKGLEAARAIAMLSYRHYETYKATQTDIEARTHGFRASSYQRYQGQKLVNRFNAYSYVRLSEAMDSHDLGRGRESVIDALRSIQARTLAIGISSDVLFPPNEQRSIAEHIPNADYLEIDSIYGHDGFLTETIQLDPIFQDFINGKDHRFRPTLLKQQRTHELN